MLRYDRRACSRKGRLHLVLGATVICFLAPLARSQEGVPTVRHFVPEVAAPGDLTTVRVEYSLPVGYHRTRREIDVRVTDSRGKRVELLPVIGDLPNSPRIYRALTTGDYEPGVYQVRVEMQYFIRGRPLRLATSPWTALTVPPRMPGERPTIRHAAPTVASRRHNTPVYVEFTLPSEHSLARSPRIVSIDRDHRMVNFLPIFISRRPPNGSGQRELQTKLYGAGRYTVRAEMEYQDPTGQTATVVSPWTRLNVR